MNNQTSTGMRLIKADIGSGFGKKLVRVVKDADAQTLSYRIHCSGLDFNIGLENTTRMHHSLYEIRSIDISKFDATKPVFLSFDVQLVESLENNDSSPCLIMLKYQKNGEVLDQQRIKYFIGAGKRKVVQRMSLVAMANNPSLVLYFDKALRGKIEIRDFRFVNGLHYYWPSSFGTRSSPINTFKRWRQSGQKIFLSSYLGEFYVKIPEGFDLTAVPEETIKVINHYLFGKIEEHYFDLKTDFRALSSLAPTQQGNTTLLSFSMGEDSTAALSLLPDDTVSFYCKRDYESYYLCNGAKVAINKSSAVEENMGQIPNLYKIENNLEKIGLAAGMGFGFRNGYGYAVLGMLLAKYFDAGVLCYGSVMEQIFLKNGTSYSDIIKIPGSLYNTNRTLHKVCGLFMALPVGGCSEVVTNKICSIGKYANLAISCPNVDDSGNSCGYCFKCFRKRRLLSPPERVSPDKRVKAVLAKRPLKSATSVIFACKNAGDLADLFPEYVDFDVDYLNRYNKYGLENLLTPELFAHVVNTLNSLGITEMSPEEDVKLRSVAKTLNEAEFDPVKAGLVGDDTHI